VSEPADTPSATKKQNDLSQIDDILKDMTNNVEEHKTLINQPSTIGTTVNMPPTGESNVFAYVHTPVLFYSNLNSFSFAGGKHDHSLNQSPNLEVITDMENTLKEGKDLLGPNCKLSNSPKSPREEQPRKSI